MAAAWACARVEVPRGSSSPRVGGLTYRKLRGIQREPGARTRERQTVTVLPEETLHDIGGPHVDPTPPGPGDPVTTRHPSPSPADPPPAAAAPVAPAAPLTIEDFRSLRRWLVVLGAIAVGALAVAIFAVSHASESAGANRVTSLERSFNRRMDEINRRLTDQKSDVARADRRDRVQFEGLDRRLRGADSNNIKAVKAAADTNRSLITLTRRVDTIARQVNRRRR